MKEIKINFAEFGNHAKKCFLHNVMVSAWRIAKNAAMKFGGKSSEYIAESMKEAWHYATVRYYANYKAQFASRIVKAIIATIDDDTQHVDMNAVVQHLEQEHDCVIVDTPKFEVFSDLFYLLCSIDVDENAIKLNSLGRIASEFAASKYNSYLTRDVFTTLANYKVEWYLNHHKLTDRKITILYRTFAEDDSVPEYVTRCETLLLKKPISTIDDIATRVVNRDYDSPDYVYEQIRIYSGDDCECWSAYGAMNYNNHGFVESTQYHGAYNVYRNAFSELWTESERREAIERYNKSH